MKPIYIKHKDIDIKKWNSCIQNSHNKMIYGYYWYLKITSCNFDAIIYPDYSAVMPLPYKKKVGLKYIVKPTFVQQLGVFCKTHLSKSALNLFLRQAMRNFLYIDTNLNYSLIPDINIGKKFLFVSKKNFILNLNITYDELYKNFNTNTKRNIKKSRKENFKISYTLYIREFLEFKMKNSKIEFTVQMQEVFTELLKYITQNGHYKYIEIRNEKNEIIAASFFIVDKSRAYYIFSASNDEGKKKNASFLIMDNFIREFSDKNIILDFEGSNIPGLERYFKGWGAYEQNYYNFKYSKFNFLIK